jgi:hypothetical protein
MNFIQKAVGKTQSYLASYFSEKFGTQIQRQVNARIIGTPATFSNLPIEALRRKNKSSHQHF